MSWPIANRHKTVFLVICIMDSRSLYSIMQRRRLDTICGTEFECRRGPELRQSVAPWLQQAHLAGVGCRRHMLAGGVKFDVISILVHRQQWRRHQRRLPQQLAVGVVYSRPMWRLGSQYCALNCFRVQFPARSYLAIHACSRQLLSLTCLLPEFFYKLTGRPFAVFISFHFIYFCSQ